MNKSNQIKSNKLNAKEESINQRGRNMPLGRHASTKRYLLTQLTLNALIMFAEIYLLLRAHRCWKEAATKFGRPSISTSFD